MRHKRQPAALVAALGLVALALHAGAPEPPRQQAAARKPAQLPPPPLPPVRPLEPPPADPWPSLYRGGVVRRDAHLLTLVTEPQPPRLKSGKPSTIKPRPHDIVQAPGDPRPIKGTIRDEMGGKIWFYNLKKIGHPKNPLRIADLLVFKRRVKSVREAYQERAKQAGNSADAHLALAQGCLDGGLLGEAEAELLRAIELRPGRPGAYLKLADLYTAQGKRDAEIGVYRAALAAKADGPEIRERLGQRCLELGLDNLAYEHFARGFQAAAKAPLADVLAKRQPLPAAPLARRLLREAAEARVIGARPSDAAPILALLAEASPDDPAVRSAQALADILAGRAKQAIDKLRQLAKAPKPPVGALNNLGAALFNTGDHQAALTHFEAAGAAAPRHTKAAVNAALACAALGRLARAQELLAGIRKPSSPSLGYRLVTGYVHERQGHGDEAARAYQQALKLDRACFHALCGMGRCHLAKGEREAAAAHFAKARLLKPADPQPLRGTGTCLYRAGKFAEAADVFRQLVADDGAPARDLARLAIACLRIRERRRQAAALLDKALRATPQDDPYVLGARAYLAYLGGAGAAGRAEALFRQAQRVAGAPEVSRYAARALRRILAERSEELTTLAFKGDEAMALPKGWREVGRGAPAPVVRNDALRFQGRPPAANVRQVVRAEPVSAPAKKGPPHTFARFEVHVGVPLTNRAAVGVLLGVGESEFQVALRMRLKPQPSRRLAYRIVRGQQATPWIELPGSIALDDFKLGLGLSERGAACLDVLLDGRLVGAPIPFDALRSLPDEITVGVFAAVEEHQECLFAVHEVDIIRKKAAAADK